MRLDINLASQPYEDARLFWMRWGTAVGAVGLLTLILLVLDVTGWIAARHDHAAISQKRDLIAQKDQVRIDAEKILGLPQNRSTRDESQFLNQLIERKAFSWTRLLENLEKVMPPRVHIVSINPQLDQDNQLALKMSVAGESRDRALELVQRMNASGRFAAYMERESKVDSQTGDTVQVEMTATYIPEAFTAPKATASPTPAVAPNKTAGAPAKGKTEIAKRVKH